MGKRALALQNWTRWQQILAAATLVVATSLLYWHTLDYGYTELDDSIFIRERESFNQDADNLWQSFRRGVFVDSGDTYYRPLLLWTFIADRHREGRLRQRLHVEDAPTDRLRTYRTTNLALHCIGSVLVFVFLAELGLPHAIAWILALLFAVHPALVQAVVWIPGRNDSLLGIATFAYGILVLQWLRQPRRWLLPVQGVVLLAALLTKETALIVGPAALGTLALWEGRQSWRARRIGPPLGVWIGAVGIWAVLRSHATVEPLPTNPKELLSIFWERLPLYVQYLGKSILPLELSVFPRLEDTSLIPGSVAVVMLAVMVARSRLPRQWKGVIAAVGWFLLFLLPALVVPRHINQEAFEHRLYVPIVGVLWLLGQMAQSLPHRIVLASGGVLGCVLAVVSWHRMESFRNRTVFWEEAVATSPHSAYARMMLGARYYLDKVNPRKTEGERLLWEAYRMDSTQKYINYYIGNLYWDRGDFARARVHYLRELALISTWAELYFRLARIAFKEGKFEQARVLLEQQLRYDPSDAQANHNLLLLYLDLGMPEKARRQAVRMRALGLPVPADIQQRLSQ